MQVAVEEEVIKAPVEIVMMRGVGPRAARPHARPQFCNDAPKILPQGDLARRRAAANVHGGEGDQIVDFAPDHVDPAGHVEVAERHLRIEGQRDFRARIGDFHRADRR